MNVTELLDEIKENLKDYPIEYLRNKATDDRYKDPLTKKLAKYNSETWDEIFSLEITQDYEIKDKIIDMPISFYGKKHRIMIFQPKIVITDMEC